MSVQLGYTVPFTLVHAGKCGTEDKLRIQTIQKTQPRKSKLQKKTKQNYPGKPG